MAVLVWDDTGKRFYETGVDHGVLYPIDGTGAYPAGYAWNGLISVTESPSGAEPSPLYADNIKYLTLMSAEEFACTLEAYTYPDEFGVCDGSIAPSPGVLLSQQARKQFGLVFRTKIGNDVDGEDHGYRLHLLYGCQASPSEKAFKTVNDSPEAITFSWEVSTTPPAITGYKPTSMITIDSRTADPTDLATLEDSLFGTLATPATLPLPDAVLAMFAA